MWSKRTVFASMVGIVVLGIVVFTFFAPVSLPFLFAPDPPVGNDLGITLPEGFHITYFAQEVNGARSLVQSESGVVYVGSRGPGNVYALVDTSNNGVSDETVIVASGLDNPNGVAIYDGDLYIAEISKVSVIRNIDEVFRDSPILETVRDDFPTDTHHGWKYIAFGPDEKLYVPVGAPCNVCEQEDERYASLLRMNPDGSDLEIYAKGIRNTVGFDWHPDTGELWFTDNGRDQAGEDFPPDELNHVHTMGTHFGFPYCHAQGDPDPKFGVDVDCTAYEPAFQNLGPHVAALGIAFYDGTEFPGEYDRAIFIAEHGSWNRKEPIGYRISLVRLDEQGKTKGYEHFAEGWLSDGQAWGRPVDVIVSQDGSLLVSDDVADAVYRIWFGG